MENRLDELIGSFAALVEWLTSAHASSNRQMYTCTVILPRPVSVWFLCTWK